MHVSVTHHNLNPVGLMSNDHILRRCQVLTGCFLFFRPDSTENDAAVLTVEGHQGKNLSSL